MKSLDSQKAVEVFRRDQSLIASFHRATPPLVWRFDLERNHSFTLALQGDESEWELGLTSPKGDFHPVAHFLMREDAEEAFVKVEQALSRRTLSWFGISLKALAIAIGLLVIVLILIGLTVGHDVLRVTSHASNVYNNLQSMSNDTSPALKNGVPLSADDVLKAPAP